MSGLTKIIEVGAANLSVGTKTGTTLDIDSSTGTNVTIPAVTVTEAGLMTAADKVILDDISISQAVDLDELEAESANLVILSGVASDAQDLGTFTGTTITDTITIKAALQELETALEAVGNDVSDATFRIQDNGDATKEIAFEASAITTGTVRTVSMPDVDVDLADVATNTTNITANDGDIADILTTLGTSDGDTDLGTFTGSTISDNTDLLAALQEIETAVEASAVTATLASTANGAGASLVGIEDSGTLITATDVEGALAEIADDIDDLATLTGVAENAEDLGTFTGTTIADNSTIKVAFQAIETALEVADNLADDLVTLSGADPNDTDLGSFTGVTISSSDTIKGALQDLETAVETVTLPSIVSKATGDSPYTALSGDTVIVGDTSAGAITINLPAAASNGNKVYIIKNEAGGSNNITIDGNSGELVEGATTYDVIPGASAKIICDATEWFKIN